MSPRSHSFAGLHSRFDIKTHLFYLEVVVDNGFAYHDINNFRDKKTAQKPGEGTKVTGERDLLLHSNWILFHSTSSEWIKHQSPSKLVFVYFGPIYARILPLAGIPRLGFSFHPKYKKNVIAMYLT